MFAYLALVHAQTVQQHRSVLPASRHITTIILRVSMRATVQVQLLPISQVGNVILAQIPVQLASIPLQLHVSVAQQDIYTSQRIILVY